MLNMTKSAWITLGATVLLLGGVAVEKMSYATAADANPYHDKVRSAIEAFPTEFDGWAAEEVDLPPSAVALLKPNAIISRRYDNADDGKMVHFLVVQCRDARDMAGHYPPVCYPASGWTPRSSESAEWRVEDKRVEAREYTFSRSSATAESRLAVVNLIIMPNGKITPSMSEVRKAAADYRIHFFGAAQMQWVFDGRTSGEERAETVEAFLKEAGPMIEAIGSGAGHE